jgi:twitching motility two-component system response regulator PilG
MIIDPSRVTRVIIDVCLRREDIACLAFADGLTALRTLQDPQVAAQVKVIILELTLSDIDGCALIRLLRVSVRLDQTAIVVLSARSGLVSRLRARLAGANEYLTKPFVQKKFLPVLSSYLTPTQEQTRPRDQEPGAPEPRTRGDEYHGASDIHAAEAEAARRRYAS